MPRADTFDDDRTGLASTRSIAQAPYGRPRDASARQVAPARLDGLNFPLHRDSSRAHKNSSSSSTYPATLRQDGRDRPDLRRGLRIGCHNLLKRLRPSNQPSKAFRASQIATLTETLTRVDPIPIHHRPSALHHQATPPQHTAGDPIYHARTPLGSQYKNPVTHVKDGDLSNIATSRIPNATATSPDNLEYAPPSPVSYHPAGFPPTRSDTVPESHDQQNLMDHLRATGFDVAAAHFQGKLRVPTNVLDAHLASLANRGPLPPIPQGLASTRTPPKPFVSRSKPRTSDGNPAVFAGTSNSKPRPSSKLSIATPSLSSFSDQAPSSSGSIVDLMDSIAAPYGFRKQKEVLNKPLATLAKRVIPLLLANQIQHPSDRQSMELCQAFDNARSDITQSIRVMTDWVERTREPYPELPPDCPFKLANLDGKWSKKQDNTWKEFDHASNRLVKFLDRLCRIDKRNVEKLEQYVWKTNRWFLKLQLARHVRYELRLRSHFIRDKNHKRNLRERAREMPREREADYELFTYRYKMGKTKEVIRRQRAMIKSIRSELD